MSLPASVYARLPRRMPLSLGFSKYALLFNGVNQYVEAVNDLTLDMGATDSFTMSSWIKTGVTIGTHIIGGKYYNGYRYEVRTPGVLAGVLYDGTLGSTIVGGIVVADNRFHYVSLVRDKSVDRLRLYVDRALDNDIADGTGNLSNALPFDIGIVDSRKAQPEYFNGVVDGFLLYKGQALTLEQHIYNMLNYHTPIRTGLVLWLPLEEGTGLTAYDKSGEGNDGSLMPAVTPPVWTRVKKWELRAEGGL